jgi:hypothetical protein
MSGRPHHRGLHHQQHPSSAATDAAGWVESISALSDEHPATALLLGSPPAGARDNNAGSSSNTANSMRRASSGGGDASPASPAGVTEPELAPAGDTAAAAGSGTKLSPEQEFDASLDHAVDVMLTEVRGGGQQGGAQAAPEGRPQQ